MIVDLGPMKLNLSLPGQLGMLTDFLVPAEASGGADGGTIVARARAPYQTEPRGKIWAAGENWEFRLSQFASDAYFSAPPEPWHIATPFRQLFAWIADQHDSVIMHAAAYVPLTHAVLIAGPSGSGKSSLVAACISALGPSGFLGDDWVSVWSDGEEWRAGALYRSLKLSPKMAMRLGLVEPKLEHRGKLIFCVEGANADVDIGIDIVRTNKSLIRAVVVPTFCSDGISIRTLSAAEATLRIAPSTLLQTPGVSPRALRNIGKLCSSVPCYQLSVSAPFLDLAPAILTELAEW